MQVLTLLFRFALLTTVPTCVLIALILLVKKAFDHRVSASFHYVIWFLLIIRLLVPFSPQSPASALNLISPLMEMVQSGKTPQTDAVGNLPKPAAVKERRMRLFPHGSRDRPKAAPTQLPRKRL